MAKKAEISAAVRSGGIEEVALGEMAVAPEAQRKFRQAHADHLLANFDIEAFGIPTLSFRDGRFYIVDGQHRIDALKRWLDDDEWEQQKVECYVYRGLDATREADAFDRLNDFKQVSAFDRFLVRCTAGRPNELTVKKVVEAEGLLITRDKVPGRIMAVTTLMWIFERAGPDTLGRTLRIIRDAYGDAGMEAMVIKGIGMLCHRYNGALDEDLVIERLGKAHGGVSGLLNKAEVLHKQTGNQKAACVAGAAVDIVNGKRGGKKLPSWWKA